MHPNFIREELINIKRVFLIVLDSFGIGAMPDADKYNDKGCNTLGSVCKNKDFNMPNMMKMGLFNIDGIDFLEDEKNPTATYARMTETSCGKDTTIGHWEIAGINSKKPLPTYPNGFPRDIISEFEKRTGRKVICNKPYSGTEVIKDYGRQHENTGSLIVYTSADSVFQIAAHEKIVKIDELYKYCEIARDILKGEHGVGRVIARPFEGKYPDYKRTSNRHDYSLKPPKTTMLDELSQNNIDVIAVGKINDIFAGKGIKESIRTKNNADGIARTIEIMNKDFEGLCFTNLVDFDMVYGHRNDVNGYAKALSEFDRSLPEIIKNMKDEDILMITADHGCDPGDESTDHTREYTPWVIYGRNVKSANSLGTRSTFSDIGATILDYFGITGNINGQSALKEVIK